MSKICTLPMTLRKGILHNRLYFVASHQTISRIVIGLVTSTGAEYEVLAMEFGNASANYFKMIFYSAIALKNRSAVQG